MEIEKLNSEFSNDILLNRDSIIKIGRTLFKRILETTSSQKNFQTILEEHQKQNKFFSDIQFPPNENSLIKGYFHLSSGGETTSNISSHSLSNNSKSQDYTLSSKWSKIKWLRSEEIYSNPQIFSLDQEMNPNDIKQGALNNCYFLSVLSALAEYPERIKSLFLTQEINTVKIYCVKLCIDGTWDEIVIDDYFPCDGRKKSPCFSCAGENNFWVMILEKCYAKAYGSYHKIEGGIPEHAMRDLTGAPTLTLDNSCENLLSSLREACEKRWIITASAGETDASKDLLKEVGLIPLHAYTILEVHEINIENDIHSHNNLTNSLNSLNGMNSASVEYLLKIRNPWGTNEWIGDWSDFSNMWKENLKLSSANSSNNQGCFFMNFKDFKHYFSKIQICKIHDNFQYNSIKLTQNMNSYCLVKMKIKQSLIEDFNDMTNVSSFISLIHKDKKKSNFFNTNDFKYPTSRFIICKINSAIDSSLYDQVQEDQIKNLNFFSDKDEFEYICGKMGQEREIFEEKELDIGEYLIFIEIDWNNINNTNNSINQGNQRDSNSLLQINKTYPFVLSTYSSNKIELSIEDISDTRYKDILQKIYVSCAKKNNNVVRFTNEDAPNCYKYTNVTPEGYAYIYFENKEEDATLIEDVKYTKFEGLKLLPPFYGTSYYVKIGPGESKIVLIKQVDLTGFNLIYSYHSNFMFGPKRLLELTKQKGKKNYRKDTKLNIDVEIVVYTYKYSLGLCFFYENNTSDRMLEETLKIKSTGVEIVNGEDVIDDNIMIVLGPGEKKLIELRAKKNNWSVQSSVSYKIESL